MRNRFLLSSRSGLGAIKTDRRRPSRGLMTEPSQEQTLILAPHLITWAADANSGKADIIKMSVRGEACHGGGRSKRSAKRRHLATLRQRIPAEGSTENCQPAAERVPFQLKLAVIRKVSALMMSASMKLCSEDRSRGEASNV